MAADHALDFDAYRRVRDAAEGAEAMLLRLREIAFAALEPGQDQVAAFTDLVEILETAPELVELRRALGRHEPLPEPVRLGS